MTHDEYILLHEAATAGWHGGKAREAMLGLSDWNTCSFPTERADNAYYHARQAATAALRCMNALEDGTIRLEE